jgi:hypothetical protein
MRSTATQPAGTPPAGKQDHPEYSELKVCEAVYTLIMYLHDYPLASGSADTLADLRQIRDHAHVKMGVSI